ncbi:MAG: A/G-specific adenine glycosylase [Planctomycetota bacterium]
MARRAADPAPFAARLLRWFAAPRRDLPWRRTRDPWAIWVSEIMLQQTRVEAVKAPYQRFLARFPTPASFAAASDDELLVAWRGLGYYRRARLLRDGARAVVAAHGGAVPADAGALAELPGVGAYTLGAVASSAFGLPLVAVDGNVEREVARHRGVREPGDAAPGRRAVRAQAEAWLDGARAGDYNQAMMELGATVCTPTSPRSGDCPVADDCVARAEGLAGELPRKKPPRPAVAIEARVALVVGPQGALGRRIAAGEPNAGQIELPGPGMLTSIDADGRAADLRLRFGARLLVTDVVATVQHAITHHRITLRAHAATAATPTAIGALRGHALDGDTPWTTPSRKVFRAALGADGTLRA